ncbi:MAG: PspC domain-containing protein [Herpetosiphonaceae bacterium]|nr:PspC domain-containing protein [Herpetosiphonaceae bacterium]
MHTQLMRSSNEKLIGGVCGGLGNYFGVDPVLVRLGFVLMTFATGIGVILYVALWLAMPQDGAPSMVNQAFTGVQQFGQQVSHSVAANTPTQPRFDPQTGQPLAQPMSTVGRNQKLGVILLGLGAVMLASFVHLSGPVLALMLLATGVYLLRKN